MNEAPASPYLVPFDGSFLVSRAAVEPPSGSGEEKKEKARLGRLVKRLNVLQRVLHADNRYSVLLIFQAMDAGGKDGTIRAVLTGVNPEGFQVYAFKQPTGEELDHDFLWRTSVRLPERGRIGVFNRSYYEEALIVRVHPELLGPQRLPESIVGSGGDPPEDFWDNRLESIRHHELHLARNGVVILKFWLNVSKEEQKRRFLARIGHPKKNWKFESADVRERASWDQYMSAYEQALNATSRTWAPWYAIPADDKPYMRRVVAEVIVDALEKLGLSYPKVDPEERATFDRMRELLENEQ